MKDGLFKQLIDEQKMVSTFRGCHGGTCPICEKRDFRIWDAEPPKHETYANCGGCGRNYTEAELECQMRLKEREKTMVKALRWQKEPPRVAGFWWVGGRDARKWVVNLIEVRVCERKWQWSFLDGMTWQSTDNYPDYEWAGPIEAPHKNLTAENTESAKL